MLSVKIQRSNGVGGEITQSEGHNPNSACLAIQPTQDTHALPNHTNVVDVDTHLENYAEVRLERGYIKTRIS